MPDIKIVFSSPEAAEEAFYRALHKCDLDLMMAVWDEDENISCVHPGGQRLEGRAAVRQSWELIFAHSSGMAIHLSDESRYEDQNLTVHVVHEHIRLGKDTQYQSPVIATNIYRLADKGWRMVMHHASPTRLASPPEVLH
ncbi:MAG TPA: nuclear transport factor 2 family protein [Acidiferrobacterales bacterium]|nr:nuclear transport factor 2 family protein [Acidiferrobacterales bacterium]